MAATIGVTITVKDDGSAVITGFTDKLKKLDSQAHETHDAMGKFGEKLDEMVSGKMAGAAEEAGMLGEALAALGPAGIAAAAAIGLTTAALGETVAVLIEAAVQAVEYAHSIEVAALKTGIGTTALQEFEAAGKHTGVGIDQLTGAIFKMQVKMENAPKNFEALGLSMSALKSMAPEEQLEAVAKAIGNIADNSERAAAGKDVFGKSAAELGAFLRTIDEAHNVDFGQILPPEMIEKLSGLGKASKDLGTAWDGMWRQLGASVAESPEVLQGIKDLTALVVDLSHWVVANRETLAGFWGALGQGASNFSSNIRDVADVTRSALGSIRTEFENMGKVLELIGSKMPASIQKWAAGISGDGSGLSGSAKISQYGESAGPNGSYSSEAQRKAAEAARKAAEAEDKAILKQHQQDYEEEVKSWKVFQDRMKSLRSESDNATIKMDELVTKIDAVGNSARSDQDIQNFVAELEKLREAGGHSADGLDALNEQIEELERRGAKIPGFTSKNEANAGKVATQNALAAIEASGLFGGGDTGARGAPQTDMEKLDEKTWAAIQQKGRVALGAFNEGMHDAIDLMHQLGLSADSTGGKLVSAFEQGATAAMDIAKGISDHNPVEIIHGITEALSGAIDAVHKGGGAITSFGAGIGGFVGAQAGAALSLLGLGGGGEKVSGHKQTEADKDAGGLRLMDQLAAGAAIRMGSLSNEWKRLADEAAKAGDATSKAMVDLIHHARETHTVVPEVEAAIKDGLAATVSGVDQMIGKLDEKTGKVSGGLDIFKPSIATAEAQIFGAAFWAKVKEDGIVEADKAFAPAFANLKTVIGAAGFGDQVKSIFAPIDAAMSIMSDEHMAGVVNGLQGADKAVQGLASSGYLTQGAFQGLETIANSTASDLISSGADANAAYQAIAPTLGNIINASQTYGFTIDENTQALIDHARTSGVSFPTDPMQKAADAMQTVADKLQQVIDKLGGVKGGIDSLPTDKTLTYHIVTNGSPPGGPPPPGGGGGGGGGNPPLDPHAPDSSGNNWGDDGWRGPGMALGGYVPATPGGSHRVLGEGGQGEYVIPENQAGSFARQHGGGGGTSVTFAPTIYVQDAGDPEATAEAVVAKLHDHIRQNTGSIRTRIASIRP